jgi:hypothetical protein
MNEQRSFYPMYLRSVETPVAGAPSTVTAGTLAPSTTIAATDTAGNTTKFSGTDNNNYVQIQIANVSTSGTPSWAYVNFGVFGNITAATVAASYPVAPNSVVVVSVDKEVSGASVIMGTAAQTANVVFTRGEGV